MSFKMIINAIGCSRVFINLPTITMCLVYYDETSVKVWIFGNFTKMIAIYELNKEHKLDLSSW